MFEPKNLRIIKCVIERRKKKTEEITYRSIVLLKIISSVYEQNEIKKEKIDEKHTKQETTRRISEILNA